MRPKPPRSRYFFGDTPDLAEILHNLDYEDNNDVAVFEDVKTPVNEPPPEFRDSEEEQRLLTQVILAYDWSILTILSSHWSGGAEAANPGAQHETAGLGPGDVPGLRGLGGETPAPLAADWAAPALGGEESEGGESGERGRGQAQDLGRGQQERGDQARQDLLR